MLCLGIFRMQRVDHANEFTSMIDTNKQLEGRIVSDIDVRQDKKMFYFLPDGYHQRILVTTTLFTDPAYGDRIVVTDKIELPKNFEDFNYQKFLEKDNVYALARYPKMFILKSGGGNPLVRLALAIKSSFITTIETRVPDPERQLLLGILIGAKRGLPDDVVEQFNQTGLSHIVAVSGFNISIIIVALAGLAKYLGRRISFWVSIFAIILYVIMTGASSSVMRAALMGVLLLLSFSVGRLYRIIPALAFAAVVMLIANPKILIWDVGFQLSFLATLGIVLFVPLGEKLLSRWQNPAWLKSTLLATLSAIVATVPLIAYQFERISLVAPLANIAVLPVVPPIMLVGFLSFIPFLGYGFGFIAKWLLTYVLVATKFFASLPYASVSLKIDGLTLVIAYVAIISLFILLNMRSKKYPIVPAKTEKITN
jgi:competence protein ComEC